MLIVPSANLGIMPATAVAGACSAMLSIWPSPLPRIRLVAISDSRAAANLMTLGHQTAGRLHQHFRHDLRGDLGEGLVTPHDVYGNGHLELRAVGLPRRLRQNEPRNPCHIGTSSRDSERRSNQCLKGASHIRYRSSEMSATGLCKTQRIR